MRAILLASATATSILGLRASILASQGSVVSPRRAAFRTTDIAPVIRSRLRSRWHDSQVAIPLGTLTARRVENLYDLMDAAYDSIEIWAHSILLGHKPIIDVNPRRSVEMQEALKQEKKARRTLGLVFPEERRYVVRSGSERINGRLKDEFGGRHVRVRGYDKVLSPTSCSA